jgi:hypothetical protein
MTDGQFKGGQKRRYEGREDSRSASRGFEVVDGGNVVVVEGAERRDGDGVDGSMVQVFAFVLGRVERRASSVERPGLGLQAPRQAPGRVSFGSSGRGGWPRDDGRDVGGGRRAEKERKKLKLNAEMKI